jgi:hypothetical protein
MRTLLALLILTLAGCSLVGDDPDIAQSVEGDVVFSLASLDFGGDGIEQRYLSVATEESYTCLLPLAVSFRQSGELLSLKVEGIAETDVCLTAIGPASARLPLAIEDGVYAFYLRHRGRWDRYRITLDGERVGVEVLESTVSRYEP